MNIILLGAPGSGKGTQSIILNKKYGLTQLSTGEMIRQNIEDKTMLGLNVQTIVNSGDFVNDDVILSMVADRISMEDCKNGFVLDGFPRNVNQAKNFDQLLNKQKQNLSSSITNTAKITANLSQITDSIAQLNLKKSLVEFDRTVLQLNNILTSLDQGQGTAGKLLKDEGLYQNLEASTKQIEMLIRDLKMHPKRYVHFSLFGKKEEPYNNENN